MSQLDQLSDGALKEVEELAKKHHSYDTFSQELERLASATWHRLRSQKNEMDTNGPDAGANDDSEPQNGTSPQAPVQENQEKDSESDTTPRDSTGNPVQQA